MSTASILERNLLALSANHPELGRVISGTESGSGVGMVRSRSGLPVPVYRGAGRQLSDGGGMCQFSGSPAAEPDLRNLLSAHVHTGDR